MSPQYYFLSSIFILGWSACTGSDKNSTETGINSDTGVDSDFDPETDTGMAAETGIDSDTGVDTGSETDTDTDTDSGTNPDTDTNELTINGDFEVGDTSGWTDFSAENNGLFSAVNEPVNDGDWSGNLVASVSNDGVASFPLIKQANLGEGQLAPNTSVTISFDLNGEIDGVGSVVIAEFFSELDGGGTSKSEILGDGPLFPTAPNDWTSSWVRYSFTTTTGPDVSGGVTFQIKADCGSNPDCMINLFIDNVSVSID